MNFDTNAISKKIEILLLSNKSRPSNTLIPLLNTLPGIKIKILDYLPTIQEAHHWLAENENPNLIISDVELMDGICFQLLDKMILTCPIILIAKDDSHAVQSFKFNCIYYLRNPIVQDELRYALNKYLYLNYQNLLLASKHIEPNAENKHSYKKRLIIRSGDKLRHVAVEDIAYFYSENDYTYLVAWENTRFIIDHKLDHLSESLHPDLFFRLSRKFIANIHAVKLVNKYFNSRLEVILEPEFKEQILISRARVPEFLGWMER